MQEKSMQVQIDSTTSKSLRFYKTAHRVLYWLIQFFVLASLIVFLLGLKNPNLDPFFQLFSACAFFSSFLFISCLLRIEKISNMIITAINFELLSEIKELHEKIRECAR